MKYRNTIFTLILLLHVCFGLLPPKALGVLPPPDGGYPGQNTAEGQSALLHLAGGTYNTALGWASLGFNVTGNFNTGVGAATLLNNTASENTATGAGALLTNSTGSSNTATGMFALLNNTTGSGNTAVGNGALDANTTGSGNIALGVGAGTSVTTANNVICIGANVVGSNVMDNSCYVGNIHGAWMDPGTVLNVGVDASGKLGTNLSSRRFKHDIKPMDKASEALLALKPVTFHYKSDTKATPQFGLIAEDVAQVNADLVVRDKEGKPYSVRYEQVNAMLLNEFLKEHREIKEQNQRLQKQEEAIVKQQKQIEALTAGLQGVSAQIEATKATPTLVRNSP